MELNNNTLNYSLALLTGLIIGWVLQPWFHAPNAGNNSFEVSTPTTPSKVTSSQLANSEKKLGGSEEAAIGTLALASNLAKQNLSSLGPDTRVEQAQGPNMEDWSGQELINYIGSLDDEAFWKKINSGKLRLALVESPRLFDELMSSVLDLQDKVVSRRLLYLFESMNAHDYGRETADSFLLEKWVTQRVKSEDRAAEWITFLGKLGVHSKESYLFLGNRLRDYVDPSQTTAILSILARKSMIYDQNLAKGEVAQLNQIIKPFFRSENDEQRMFAVASLLNTPFEQSASQLLPAMSDESRRVRMTAMRVIRDNRFDTPEISASLMTSLSDASLSAYERLGAYEVLSRADLSQEQYETVYRFAENERAMLEQEFIAERQAAQSENR